MNRNAWRCSITVVSLAALAMTGWSLYVIAHDTYGVPKLFAYGAVAVFDGAAIACMYLASVAVQEGRAAIGAVLGTLVMAGVSCYLNTTHARLLDGHLPVVPAAILFSSPTLALLLPSGLAWSAARYRARVERGEIPFRLPAFGGWVWLLAPARAGRSIKQRAVDHIEHAGRTVSGQRPDKSWSATDRLRDHFGGMDPADVIRIAHESQPELPPTELASLLSVYGVHVDAVQVALVLHGRPVEYTVDRVRTEPDREITPDPQIALIRADMLSGQRPATIGEAVRALLQKGLKDRAAAVSITCELLGPDTSPDSVRRIFDREIKKPAKPEDEGVGQGGGGYA